VVHGDTRGLRASGADRPPAVLRDHVHALHRARCGLMARATRAAPGGVDAALTERESYIRAIVLDVGVAHEIEKPRVVQQDETSNAVGFMLCAELSPRSPILREVDTHPAFILGVGVRDLEFIAVALRERETPAGQAIQALYRRGLGTLHPDDPHSRPHRGYPGEEQCLLAVCT